MRRDAERYRARVADPVWAESERRRKQVDRANRRAAGFGVPGVLTLADIAAVIDAPGATCAYCGSGAPLGIDHIVAMTLGGPNTRENLQPCCKACNAAKHIAQKPGAWSWAGDVCLSCERSDRRHWARGLCMRCYRRDRATAPAVVDVRRQALREQAA